MTKIYVNEKWCLGCHLCEYNCAYANSGMKYMWKALKNKPIYPRIHVEEDKNTSFPVSCRQCNDPICVKSCIAGALYIENGVIRANSEKCIGCLTCVLVCPFGAPTKNAQEIIHKCELCMNNANSSPACVAGCPNKAIVYEERY